MKDTLLKKQKIQCPYCKTVSFLKTPFFVPKLFITSKKNKCKCGSNFFIGIKEK